MGNSPVKLGGLCTFGTVSGTKSFQTFPDSVSRRLSPCNCAVYREVASRGVVIRYRGSEIHCEDCVRITVGTPEENEALMALLRTF